MGFQHGLSGLNAAARNLDVIGNNVANSNTVGAKSTRAEFADLYANSLSGAGASFSGIGVTVAAVTQTFTQGDIATTANPLDMAINGKGFFQMYQNGVLSFTRNGQFKVDKDGYIVNAQGNKLMGYRGDGTGGVPVGVPGPLQVDVSDVKPKATDAAQMTLNLDARSSNVTLPFNSQSTDTYSGATSLAVYDGQGIERTLSVYFQKTANNVWDVYAAADGQGVGAGRVGTLQFDSTGALDTSATSATTTPINLAIPSYTTPDGKNLGSINMTLDLARLTQFGSSFSVADLKQNGYTAGRLAGFSVGGDGTMLARYTNGQTIAQGQVVLANFANPQGLAPQGGNGWQQTIASGPPLTAAPGTGSLGVLQSGAVEQSNVDLTGELVNMITAQRSYQANAQTIRTQDQVLQTIVNLR